MLPFTTAVRKNGDVAVLDLAGRFTIGSATGVILGAVNNLLKAGERSILLNLEDVVYLDSAAGIGELVASYLSVHKVGGQLKLLRPGARVEHVLQTVRLNQVFETHRSEDEAIRSFAARSSTTSV